MKRIITAVAFLLTSILATSVFAQGGYKIEGVIVDAGGPVIGVTVMELNSSTGTSTGVDGDYSLTVSSPDAIIEISCVGYLTQQFKASAIPKTITLAEDSDLLVEVVVIGYGTVKKTDMTGSVASVKADDINRGAITSPSQALVGKVSGLNIIPASGEDRKSVV